MIAKRFARRLALALAVGSCVSFSGCVSLLPGTPEPAVGDDQVALAIRAFLDTSALLSQAFSYPNAHVEDVSAGAAVSRVTGFGSTRPFSLRGLSCDVRGPVKCSQFNAALAGTTRESLIQDYVENGWQLSQILCRNYLSGLSEKNSAFAAIKRQFNITGGLAQLTMATARASARSIAYFGAAEAFLNATLENFGEYEYLTPDQSTLQDLVYKSQKALAEYYSGVGRPTSLVGAINAVHRIDSMCTRSGLRHLINRAINNVSVSAEGGVLAIGGGTPPSFITENGLQQLTSARIEINAILKRMELVRPIASDESFSIYPADKVAAAQKTLNDLYMKLVEAEKKYEDLRLRLQGGTT